MSTAAAHIILSQKGSLLHVNLTPTVAATDDGSWMDTGEYSEGSVQVTIATTATVQIRGSDGTATGVAPADSVDGNQLGSDITATGTYDLVRAPRWIKAKVSAWTSGNVDVKVTLRRTSGR